MSNKAKTKLVQDYVEAEQPERGLSWSELWSRTAAYFGINE